LGREEEEGSAHAKTAKVKIDKAEEEEGEIVEALTTVTLALSKGVKWWKAES